MRDLPVLEMGQQPMIEAEGLRIGRNGERLLDLCYLALDGPGFFRAIWIDEIVIEGLEIRPLGLDSVEFDEAGEMEIGFLAIKPGRYYMKVPGSTGETQRIEITIE